MFTKEHILRLRASYSPLCASCGQGTTVLDRVLCSIAGRFNAYCSECVKQFTEAAYVPDPFPAEDSDKTVSAHPTMPVNLMGKGTASPISGDATAVMRHYNRCKEAYGYVTPRQLVVLRYLFMGARTGAPVTTKVITREQGESRAYWRLTLEALRVRGIVKLSAPRQYVLA